MSFFQLSFGKDPGERSLSKRKVQRSLYFQVLALMHILVANKESIILIEGMNICFHQLILRKVVVKNDPLCYTPLCKLDHFENHTSQKPKGKYGIGKKKCKSKIN